MVFTFSIALQSQITHVQMLPRFPIPLAFLALLYFKDSFNPKHLFFAILMVIYQVYCGVYLGFMLMVPVAIFLIVLCINRKETLKFNFKLIKWRNSILAGLILNILLLAPLMIPYMERSRGASINTYFKILHNLPTLKSFFFSQKGSLLWDFLSETGNSIPEYWNHQLFTGGLSTISLIIFCFYFIYHRIKAKETIKKNTLYLFFICGQ